MQSNFPVFLLMWLKWLDIRFWGPINKNKTVKGPFHFKYKISITRKNWRQKRKNRKEISKSTHLEILLYSESTKMFSIRILLGKTKKSPDMNAKPSAQAHFTSFLLFMNRNHWYKFQSRIAIVLEAVS